VAPSALPTAVEHPCRSLIIAWQLLEPLPLRPIMPEDDQRSLPLRHLQQFAGAATRGLCIFVKGNIRPIGSEVALVHDCING
jgi:hypothetical protein